MALGPLEMDLADFWDSSPAEITDLLRGYEWREKRDWDKVAWLAAHIINISGKYVKKNVRPKQLLERQTGTDPIARAEGLRMVREKLERRNMH